MLSVLLSICYRPSVCLSVTQVDHTRTTEARIIEFSPYSNPIPLVVGNKPFSSFKHQYLENSRRYDQSYY